MRNRFRSSQRSSTVSFTSSSKTAAQDATKNDATPCSNGPQNSFIIFALLLHKEKETLQHDQSHPTVHTYFYYTTRIDGRVFIGDSVAMGVLSAVRGRLCRPPGVVLISLTRVDARGESFGLLKYMSLLLEWTVMSRSTRAHSCSSSRCAHTFTSGLFFVRCS